MTTFLFYRTRRILLVWAVVIGVLGMMECAEAQTESKKLTFGLVAGYALNQHSANFTELPGYPIYAPRTGAANEPANFTGGGTQGGIALSALVQYELSPSLAIQMRLGYADRTGKATTTENYTIGLLSPIAGSGTTRTSAEASSVYTITANLATLNIEPVVVFSPLAETPLRVMAGIGLNLLMTKKFDQNEQLVLPAGVIAGFTDGRGAGTFPTTRNVQSADIPNASGMIPTVQVGVGYEFAVSKIALTPEIMYSLMLGNFASDISWKASGIRFAIGARLR